MSIKRAVIIGILTIVIFLSPAFVFAQEDKYGLAETAKDTKLSGISISKSNPERLIATIVTTALGFVGTIFFILMLYGGITWMTAMGSTEKVNKAKSILEMAIVGLVIVVASYAISTFIFSRFTATPVAPTTPTSTP